ncbi:hypothetical protein ACHAQA_004633 [Verticillium albo-atrum]
MCVEDIAYCPFCGFQRTMHFHRCDDWERKLWAFNDTYPSNCLSNKAYPSPKKCQLLTRNLKMEIRPGACPRGPPKEINTCAVESEGSPSDDDADDQEEEGRGCPGYEVKAELKRLGAGQWEEAWGHRVLRWKMGLPQAAVMEKRTVAGPGALGRQPREEARNMAREIRMMRLPRHAQQLEMPQDVGLEPRPETGLIEQTEAEEVLIEEPVMGRMGDQKQRRIQWAGPAHKVLEQAEEEGSVQGEKIPAAPGEKLEALGVKMLPRLATHTSQFAGQKGKIGEAFEKGMEHLIIGPPVTMRVRHFNGPMEMRPRHRMPAPAPQITRVYGVYRKEEFAETDKYVVHRALQENWTDTDKHNARMAFRGNW